MRHTRRRPEQRAEPARWDLDPAEPWVAVALLSLGPVELPDLLWWNQLVDTVAGDRHAPLGVGGAWIHQRRRVVLAVGRVEVAAGRHDLIDAVEHVGVRLAGGA